MGHMLKEILAAKGITTAELGRRINRSPRMVNYYLSGEWPIPSDVARNIAFTTGIKIDVIQGNGKRVS
jgi:transcriptional regulator with XRE-family HTH domain